MIEHLGTSVLYENPRPHVRSRHGYFPGLVLLSSGDLLALFVISEAFESADAPTHVARSGDLGKTWRLEGPLLSKLMSDVDSGGDAGSERLLDRQLIEMKKEQKRLENKERPDSGYSTALSDRHEPPASDYLKPAVLRDGTVVAMGYRSYREDPDKGISVEETGGILPGDDVISFSQDEGRTWTPHRIIPRRRPELYEISGPCIELSSGDLIAVAALFKTPDGRNPSGQAGILLRSRDRGETWSDDEVFFRSPTGNLTPFESRLCEMQAGRLVALAWAYDAAANRHYPNHCVVSHDNGRTWSEPIDTGLWGQASNLLWLGGDSLLTIHAHRGDDPAIFVRLVDLSQDRWRTVEELPIYGYGSPAQTRHGQKSSEMFASLRFGQPSLLRIPDGEFLAAHWAVEDGQGKIRLHWLRMNR